MAIPSPTVQSRFLCQNGLMNNSNRTAGTVYLVGAGPGDPGMLTLRGQECLHRADIVLYDGLSSMELLQHAPSAEYLSVGKHGKSRIWKQSEIIAEMLRHARSGKTVVRLKGGDPAVFARTAEEAKALQTAKIPFEIVPGITAALAAGSMAGIPVTDRNLASAVALVTGHEEPGKPESALDWNALAQFPGTLVVYMGVTTAKTWTGQLLDAGKDPATPSAIIRRCSLPDQQTIHCRLDEVASQLTPASQFRPPVITIIGPVTQLADTMDWFSRRPLHQQTVLVTRPLQKSRDLVDRLREVGANAIIHPAIETGPLTDHTELDECFGRLQDYDCIVFCSENGVRHFLDRMLRMGLGDLRRLAGQLIACVGSKTAQVLREEYHLHADLVPQEFNARSLAESIDNDVRIQRVLVVRASRGHDTFRHSLAGSSTTLDEIVAYSNHDCPADPEIAQALKDGQIDWITVTSSATAESLHHLFGDSLHRAKMASLSPVTSKTLRDLGYKVQTEANPSTMEALVQAIVYTVEHSP